MGSEMCIRDRPYPGLLRHSHRLHEIALQQMIEGTARPRLGRALNTKTLSAGQIEGYKVGEEVDFCQPPSTKDVSGWMGPATVVDVSELSRGHISARLQRGTIVCRLADVRRHLHFLCLLAAPLAPTDQPATLQSVRALVDDCMAERCCT